MKHYWDVQNSNSFKLAEQWTVWVVHLSAKDLKVNAFKKWKCCSSCGQNKSLVNFVCTMNRPYTQLGLACSSKYSSIYLRSNSILQCAWPWTFHTYTCINLKRLLSVIASLAKSNPFHALRIPLKLIPSLAAFLQRWMRTLQWPIKTAAFISRLSERMKDLGQQDRCCSSDQCPRCVLTGFAWRSWIKRVPGLCQWHCGERGVKTRLWAGKANRMRAGLEGLAVVSWVRLL